MKPSSNKLKFSEKGFTIIELLISTVVFSMVLLLCATAIIQVGRIYYKGVTTNKIQEIARVVTDDISQSIQFGSSADADSFYTEGQNADGTKVWKCIGQTRYIYNPKVMLGESKHVLWKDRPSSCTENIGSINLNSDEPTSGGKELLGQGMRVPQITISSAEVWNVSVTISYGEKDLFTNQDTLNQCVARDRGGQFCAVSTITTNVAKRL